MVSPFRTSSSDGALAQSVSDSLEQLLLFLAQTIVSCSEILGAREGGCQGAPGQGHRVLFESRGSPFFESFFGALFFTQNCDC